MSLWPAFDIEVKFAIIVGCTGVILLSLMTVICFLLPDSWWRCWWQGGDLAQLSQKIRSETTTTTIKQNVNNKEMPRGSFDMVAMTSFGPPPHRSNRTYSQDSGRANSLADSCSTISSLGSISAINPSCPQISLAIKFVIGDDGDDRQQIIIVTIQQCQDLPARSYCETVDARVHLRLERKRSLSLLLLLGGSLSSSRGGGDSRRILADDDTCPVVQRSLQPQFKHTVTLTVPAFTSIKDCQLIATVDDEDKLLGRNELGRCRVDLAELVTLPLVTDQTASAAAASSAGGQHLINRPLKSPQAFDKGDVLIGLSFLPTSQRITIQIARYNRIPTITVGSAEREKAISRIYLLNESGRILKKRKTAPKDWPLSSSSAVVEVDEHFQLDVEMDQWDHCVLVVVLERFNEPTVSSSPSEYRNCGHVSIGKRVTGHAERIHWNSAFQSPRKLIIQWHALR